MDVTHSIAIYFGFRLRIGFSEWTHEAKMYELHLHVSTNCVLAKPMKPHGSSINMRARSHTIATNRSSLDCDADWCLVLPFLPFLPFLPPGASLSWSCRCRWQLLSISSIVVVSLCICGAQSQCISSFDANANKRQ